MPVLVQDKVKPTLLRMAAPMLIGTFAMNAYNLTDTWFVSQLGKLPLAAMGFTFPVVMLLTCLAGGIGTGVTTLVSHALGRRDHEDAARVTTHGILLTTAVAVTIAIIGYCTIDPVFARLGADAKVLPLIGEYMRTWYAGALFMALPMMGNGILISAGDSRAAGRLMMAGTLLNTALDPIMIFGWLGCPALGMRGAALATVISQAVSAVWLFWLLARKHRLLSARRRRAEEYFCSLRGILALGVPSILSMVLMPISSGVVTNIVSKFGNSAVAACGAAQRLEMFAFVIPMALGISLMPFVSQNLGAGRSDRIAEAARVSACFAVLYGAGIAVVFWLSAPLVAPLFSDDAEVISVLRSYIRITSFGYGLMEVHRYAGVILTGLHRPVSATALNAMRVLALLVPLSYLGAYLGGIRGVFCGRLSTDLLSGAIGFFWVRSACASLPPPAPAETRQA